MNGQPQSEPAIPPLKPIESTHLEGAAHDPVSKTLFVSFKDQSVYAYSGVETGTYVAMRAAESPGQFFNARIKGQFRSAKLKSAPPKAQPQS